VDRPLREGITRWQQAVAQEPANFSAHEELARLAELRDQFDLAAAEYETAWHLRPPRRDLLLDLGRVWREQGRTAQSNAALLAASRGAEPRVAETARALLPDHYPYVYEFENALQLDPTNAELRRELAYLHQAMGNTPAAAQQFEQLPERAPVAVVAQPALLDRAAPSLDAKWMGERSLEKGFLNDAARYLHSAHESDPSDFNVMLKLGWTHNMLRQDREAVRWFDLARRSPDVITAQEAAAAYRSLSATTRRVRTSAWMFPMISTRWKNAFAYAQVKAELLDKPVHPYASVRFIGDLRGPIRPFVGAGPQYLSERSAIFAIGVNATTWHGATPWFEIGRAISYQTGAGQADLRGGVSYAKTVHRYKWFAETNDDLLYVSRFNKDTLLYSQNHAGWSVNDAIQVFWNANLNTDVKREYWANTTETGPGVRWRFQKVQLSVNFLRGVYLKNTGNPYRPNYNDIRIGAWYAFSR
jgi:tetratricopeptide (TPR) repeat protein